MTVLELISHLRRHDIRLWVDREQLRFSSPKGALTVDLRQELTTRKAEILAFLTETAGSTTRDEMPITHVARDGRIPLSFAQQRLWFLDQLAPNTPTYNMPCALRLRGPLNIAAIERALNEIVHRHEVLRTIFPAVDGTPHQLVTAFKYESLPMLDLETIREADREPQVARLAAQEARRAFDLAQGPLMRSLLIRLHQFEHILLLNMHHIVSDGWSIGLLLGELTLLYDAFLRGEHSPLPNLSIQYADYTCWHRQWLQARTLPSQMQYWRNQLDGPLPILSLPTDRPRPVTQTYRGAHHHLALPVDLTVSLKSLSQREGVTLFMLLIAAFKTLLCRHTGQEDILVGSPVAGRPRTELESLIGFFVNVLVFRTDMSGNPRFRELLQRVRDVTLDASANQDVPFEMLVEELHPQRDRSLPPILQVMFVLQNTPSPRLAASDLAMEVTSVETGTAKFDLTLIVEDTEQGIDAVFEYNTDLFDASTIDRLAGHFQSLLEGIVADPSRRISELPLLTETERRLIVSGWNQTRNVRGSDRCVHERFEARVDEAPEAPAVVFEEQVLTYGELNERANRLAHYLRRLGVGPEVLVGVCVERSLGMIIALLGIMKAGGAYLPLDPRYPRDRLDFMLEDSRAALVLTESALAREFSDRSVALVCLDSEWDSIAEHSSTNPGISVRLDNLAYVIYTSGTTGRPKGVLLTHRGLGNFAEVESRMFGLGIGSRVLQFASLSFDAATAEISRALLSGATLYLAGRESLMPGPELAEFLRDNAITMVTLPPTALAAIPDDGEMSPSLQIVTVAGEACPVELARRWSRGRRFLNLYGPTEATIMATAWEMDAHGGDLPIGKPIENVRTHILDRHLNPVPVGVAGELYIGGIGLARGYHDRPDLTAERFVPDPLGLEPGGRLYRTGDLVRYLPDGDIEFMGRIDHQVKIRGFRVEPGEIETAIDQHPGIGNSVVVVREDVPGDKRLVAYVVPCPGSSIAAAELRELLKQRLPDFMVPATFVVLGALPLTPNGKVDRSSLPVPAIERSDTGVVYVEAHSPVEEVVAGIWADLLRLDRVGVRDNFFDLGGHSLLATQVISRLRQVFEVELPLQVLFATPTVADLAAGIESAVKAGDKSNAPSLEPVQRGEILPLSFAQERLWFLDQWESGSPFYNVPLALRLLGRLDVTILESCLTEIVRRHESLRTTFHEVGGEPAQLISTAHPVHMPVVDLHILPESDREAEVQRVAHEEAQRPFDLAHGPLFRALLLRVHAEEHVLLLTMHHIVCDAWSMQVFFRELSTLYEAFLFGKPSPLPDLKVQYADFATWQRAWLSGETMERQLAYWRTTLGRSFPVLELPTDRPRPARQSFRGSHFSFGIGKNICRGLKALCRHEGATLFMGLLGAFQVLLHRYSGQDDIVVGTPVSNRTRSEIEGLIGFFVNTLVIRADLSGDPSFREALGRVRETALGAYSHQDVPFEKLVEELQPERDLSHTPLFQVMFTLQNALEHPPALTNLAVDMLEIETGTSKFDLTLSMEESEDGLSATWEYNSDLFNASTIEWMAEHFRVLLDGIVCNPDRRVSELPLLTDAERHHILTRWNDTQLEYPKDLCIHELFENQVERTPDAIAVVLDDQQVTYGELNRRSNRLAHHLRAIGVGPDALVGICVERSAEMIVGILGILKAGAAYVPVDPAYPRDRIAFMLADARATVLLTQARLLSDLPELQSRVICLDMESDVWAREDESNPEKHVVAENLAYVIYTSGSTGMPKGVALSHRTLTNLMTWQARTSSAGEQSRTLQFAPPSFDVSCQEVFATLGTGGTLVLISDDVRRDGPALLRFLDQAKIERLFVPYVALQQLADVLGDGGETPASLREVITAGEQLLVTQAVVDMFGKLSRCVLSNQYGPSEAHVVTEYLLEGPPADWRSLPPIGRPIANTQIYLLDKRLQPVPVGVAGELYIAGDGLARGYLNRHDATAERFIPDPFSGMAGARLYRTGDLARYLPDGNIDFLGRIDNQVKVRGFRVELGEIEVALERERGVRAAVAVVREDSPGDRRLVAYVVPENGANLATGELRGCLKQKLPEYMLPSAIVILESLPQTPSGKVDRRALPAPNWSADEDGSPPAAPRTPVEEVLSGIWSEVLKATKVGVHDNFFDLGGHSLLATQVISRIRSAFGVELPLRRTFEAPTVATLAESIEAALRAGEGLTTPPLTRLPQGRREAMPLSFSQQRLWFLNQLEPGAANYNIPSPLRLRGKLNVESLRWAFAEIVRRHESLRTRFGTSAGEPVQIVDDVAPVPLPVIDLSEVHAEEREAEILRLTREHARLPFSLSDGPVIRAKLLRLADDEHVFLVTMHHIVSDGWSLGILLEEMAALYNAASSGHPSPLAELPVQYGDYAAWQREWLNGDALEAPMAYWKSQLGGKLPVLDLPTDHQRPKVMTFNGKVQARTLSREFSERLETICRRMAVTPFMVLLAAFKTLLFRYTGQCDILVGTPVANRNCLELEGLIGLFVNTLVLRTDLSGNPTAEELLHRVRDVTLGAFTHQDVPFERLVENLEPQRDPGRNPIFQVMFALQNAPETHPVMTGVTIETLDVDSAVAHFDLSVVVAKSEGEYTVWLEYNTGLFADETMTRVLGHFERLSDEMVRVPHQRLLDLTLSPAPEREEIARRVNAVEAAFSQNPAVRACVAIPNEMAPTSQPLAVYVVCGEGSDAGLELHAQIKLDGSAGPITVLRLGSLPLMEDGQVDRSALIRMRPARLPNPVQRPQPEGAAGKRRPLDQETRKSELARRRATLSADKQQLLQKRLRCETSASAKSPAPPSSCLVEIQPSGTKRPFLCVHPLGGDVMCFFPLSRHLGSDQPFHGFQSRGLQQDQDPLTRIEDMAATYVGEFRRIQPDGPYLLGGWSFGGLVAYEMAQQLHGLGCKIAVLAIMDTTPGMKPERRREARDPAFYEDNSRWLLAIAEYIQSLWGRDLALSEDDLNRLAPDEQLSFFVDRLRSANLMSSGVTLHQLRRLLNVFKCNSRAWCAYVPRLYPGRITLIRSEGGLVEHGGEAGPGLDDSGSGFEDPTLGWGGFSTEPVDVHTIPGTHLTMLSEPNVQILANQLKKCFEGPSAGGSMEEL